MAFRPREAGMEVLRIFPDTPAAGSEVRTGDLITAVDGKPVHERGCSRFGDAPVGTENVLTVLRGDETLELTLTIAELVP